MVLPKQLRLRGYKCFDYLYKEGKRYYGSLLVLRVAKAKPKLLKNKIEKVNTLKCAVSISHKVSKKAITRNKMRRTLHDYLSKKLLKANYRSWDWALFSLKPGCSNEDSLKLIKECDKLLLKSGLL